MPEITPPELIGKDFSQIIQTRENDLFRLGIIIFQVLLGYHPFSGIWLIKETAPAPRGWIKYGYWVNGRDSRIGLDEGMTPITVLHPQLQQLFLRCFNEGHAQPSLRPTVAEWEKGLTIAISELVQCSKVAEHFYHREFHACHWCARASMPIPDINIELPTMENAETT